jgi:hypothetical protein
LCALRSGEDGLKPEWINVAIIFVRALTVFVTWKAEGKDSAKSPDKYNIIE